MAEVINLRKARKRVEREARAREAEANRILHGRSKAERELDKARTEKAARALEAHRLDGGEAG